MSEAAIAANLTTSLDDTATASSREMAKLQGPRGVIPGASRLAWIARPA